MRPDVTALFRDLADRSPEEREAYYAREAVPDALRAEVESLLRYDQDNRSLQGYIASAHRLMLEETNSQTRGVTIDPPDPAIPERIGRFVVTRLLGRGGMGHVYLTRDPVIDRPVAVKLIGSGLEDDRGRRRLLREARTAGRLLHPNIVTIFEAGEFDGRTFIAMEYVAGETLGSIIRRRAALPLQRRIEMVEGACAGLAHAHRAGVVHLDIKPDNLMLDESGVVKVLDFGISRLQSETRSTRHGGGTLRYMSPEQIQGKPIDHHSDVFSLGCASFELIAYAPAFNGTTGEIFRQITLGPAPSLLNVSPDSDRRLDDIIRRAMALDPAQRYNDLDDMRTELAAVRASLNPASSMVSVSSPSEVIASAPPASPSDDIAVVVPLPVQERRRTWWSSRTVLATSALAIVLVGAAIGAWKSRTARDAATARAPVVPRSATAPAGTATAPPGPAQVSSRVPVVQPQHEVWGRLARGDRPGVIEALANGRDPALADAVVETLRATVLQTREAATTHLTARRAASYRAAEEHLARANRLASGGQPLESMRALWEAADAYARAMSDPSAPGGSPRD